MSADIVGSMIFDDDSDISELAVKALKAATNRAIASGRKVLIISDGKLIEIEGDKRTILGNGPRRIKVSERIKRIRK